ncbi:hypothetical protein BC943DRAFT_332572 [Umbelopsis sp. AD052]|nr:hypothetical protein BC943DRAFT_332572 [Umbelopsis sp. AD052]
MPYCSWDQVRRQVRNVRASIQSQAAPSSLMTIKDYRFDTAHNRLFFLSNDISSTIPTIGQLRLYSVDLENLDENPLDHQEQYRALPWNNVFSDLSVDPNVNNRTVYWDTASINPFRMHGITSYQTNNTKVLLCCSGTALLGEIGKDSKLRPLGNIPSSVLMMSRSMESPASPILRQHPPINSYNHGDHNTKKQQDNNTRFDIKFGGQHGDAIAFIRGRDIWVSDFYGNECQLTHCATNEDPTLMCGVAEFVMQEEFHRFSAYYWCPPVGSSFESILYLETSELEVDICLIPKSTGLPLTSMSPGLKDGELDQFRYPRTGSKNAKSDICIVEFDSTIYGTSQRITTKRISNQTLLQAFPWMEYIVRFGWMPDGKSIWVQLLSRLQKHMALVRIPVSQFQPDSVGKSPGDDWLLEDAEILLEEHNNLWINVCDIFKFIHTKYRQQRGRRRKDTETQFIWSSERSGYRHIYLITKHVDEEKPHMHAITSGDWCVLDKQISVDERRQLIYFMAKKDTPLESHLYVASYNHDHLSNQGSPIARLTELGFSHNINMEDGCCRFVDSYSSMKTAPVNIIRYISHSSNEILPTVKAGGYSLQPCLLRPLEEDTSTHNAIRSFQDTTSFMESGPKVGHGPPRSATLDTLPDDNSQGFPAIVGELPIGQIFNFINSEGVTIYGCLYKPHNYVPGTKYPTLLSVYGGPKSQLVSNDYKFPRLMRQFMTVQFGFAVLIVDGRGSSDRGLEFESYIYRRLGTVELNDQLEAIDYVAREKIGAQPTPAGELVSVIDINRVAINGWSYGGYLSLMGLAQFPEIFKLAIAGAPVTRWELYDSAYTERYLGHIEENPEGYLRGSVMNYVFQFPEKANRLLIVHGLIDENVHFQNTEELVTALNEQGKPHQLQVYPSERHGLRHASVNEHYETLMFFWLINYL